MANGLEERKLEPVQICIKNYLVLHLARAKRVVNIYKKASEIYKHIKRFLEI